ncbi:hypothetical protein SLE2022_238780 [Rubroshorea leprosula]
MNRGLSHIQKKSPQLRVNAVSANYYLMLLFSIFTETFKLIVKKGLTYLFWIVNSILLDSLFFSIVNHTVTVVGFDASYVKPFKRSFIFISPGQIVDVLVEANQCPNHYYMAASVHSIAVADAYNTTTTTTTAIVEYNGNYTPSSSPMFPYLPGHNDLEASFNFTCSLRSLTDKEHPIDVPMEINTLFGGVGDVGG